MSNKFQIFTPKEQVNLLLDGASYKENLFGKKFLENSCGDGNILSEAVQRYITDGQRHGLKAAAIAHGLESDIFGYEIDGHLCKQCICRLNAIAEEFGILNIHWNIIQSDFLRMEDSRKYDFVVGNPPYITNHELSPEEREFLQNNFVSCKKGRYNYFYAFIEKSISLLSASGKLSYLVPESIFKTKHGKEIRREMQPYIKKVCSFSQEKIFPGALVKSSIVVLDKGTATNTVDYHDFSTGFHNIVQKDALNDKWNFHFSNAGERQIGDYLKASYVVATLKNDVFVLRDGTYTEKGTFYQVDKYSLESELIHEAASPSKLRLQKKEKIIFPYLFDSNGHLIRLAEDDLQRRFPGVYSYLSSHKNELADRDIDAGSLWFEYGRTQALSVMNQEKYLMSTVVSGRAVIYPLSANCIPYAGIFLQPSQEEDRVIAEAIESLQSENFVQYANDVGVHINGKSVRITATDVENFRF